MFAVFVIGLPCFLLAHPHNYAKHIQTFNISPNKNIYVYISKCIRDVRDKYTILVQRLARPDPDQALDRMVPVRPVRGPGLGLGRAGLGISIGYLS